MGNSPEPRAFRSASALKDHHSTRVVWGFVTGSLGKTQIFVVDLTQRPIVDWHVTPIPVISTRQSGCRSRFSFPPQLPVHRGPPDPQPNRRLFVIPVAKLDHPCDFFALKAKHRGCQRFHGIQSFGSLALILHRLSMACSMDDTVSREQYHRDSVRSKGESASLARV